MSNRVELADETGAAITDSNPLAVSITSGNVSAEYNATPPVLADGEGTALQTNASGTLKVQAFLTDSAGVALDLDGTVPVKGELPEGDADSAPFPVAVGGQALAALSAITLLTSGDRGGLALDLDKALIFKLNGANGDTVKGRATNTDGAATECIAAQSAGIKIALTDITLSNSSASFVTVDIKDGSTIIWTFPVPATSGVTHRFETPLIGTAATAMNFDPSAAASTITCCMAGKKTKV